MTTPDPEETGTTIITAPLPAGRGKVTKCFSHQAFKHPTGTIYTPPFR